MYLLAVTLYGTVLGLVRQLDPDSNFPPSNRAGA